MVVKERQSCQSQHQAAGQSARAALVVEVDRQVVPAFLVRALGFAEAGNGEAALHLLTEKRLREIEALSPESDAFIHVHCVLAHTWKALNRLCEAAQSYEQIRAQSPHLPILAELAQLYRSVGRYSQARDCYRDILQLDPDWPDMIWGYAVCLIQTGCYQEGMALFETLLSRDQATPEMHLSFLFYQYYRPEMDRASWLQGYRDWVIRHAPGSATIPAYTHELTLDRRLRIGYLSTDFRRHSVTYTFEPLLDGHHRQQFECYGYGDVSQPDETTARLREKFDHYQDVTGQSPAEIAECIRQDRIDILVTLAGHYTVTGMQTHTLRPAPIQVDIGSMSSLGLDCVDYRITDAIQDPEASQVHYCETLVPIPGGYLPYAPPMCEEPVGPLPALQNGYVTFGAFANHLKITPAVIQTWSAILQGVPQSRLVIKCSGAQDEEIRQQLLDRFGHVGISTERLQLVGWLTTAEHWQLFHTIDMALDTFPYNGCLTILEALWMGIPTVSVVGDTYIGRTGMMILERMGLSCLIGSDPAQMEAIAMGLAHNLSVLTRLRAGLRQVLVAGPLCDASRIASQVEAAYQVMWRRWCRSQTAGRGASYG